MPVRICVAIRQPTTEKVLAAVAQASQWADLVEIRADYIAELNIGELFREKHPCPVIFTLRSRQEGGNFGGAERNRLELIVAAARAGADYVDVEYSAYWKAVAEAVPAGKLILSSHVFNETPPDLESLIDSMSATGAGIVKVATFAQRLADNVIIARALRHGVDKGLAVCALAMGSAGMPSRILGPSWGSWMTFASLPGADATADGQIPADRMVDVYRVRLIGSGTQLYGVVGRPVAHSLSPQVHNAGFTARGLDAVYLPLEAADFEDFLAFDAAFPVRGASITIPFKQNAYKHAGSLSVEADQTGAVNTLMRHEKGWHGENADVAGFIHPLHRRVQLHRMRAVVLGAGGAARAVVHALKSHRVIVCVAARKPEQARAVAEKFHAEYIPWEQLQNQRWDILVNATPLGMYPEINQSPVPKEHLTGEWVYDLVYNPRQTQLLKDAAARGCHTIPGTEMFLGQALKQHQLWCGSPVPEPAMRETLESALDG